MSRSRRIQSPGKQSSEPKQGEGAPPEGPKNPDTAAPIPGFPLPGPAYYLSSYTVQYANPGADGLGASVQLRPPAKADAPRRTTPGAKGRIKPDPNGGPAERRAALELWLKHCGSILRRDVPAPELGYLRTSVMNLPYNRALDPEAYRERDTGLILRNVCRPTAAEIDELQKFLDVIMWIDRDSRPLVWARVVGGLSYRDLVEALGLRVSHFTVREQCFAAYDHILCRAAALDYQIFPLQT